MILVLCLEAGLPVSFLSRFVSDGVFMGFQMVHVLPFVKESMGHHLLG